MQSIYRVEIVLGSYIIYYIYLRCRLIDLHSRNKSIENFASSYDETLRFLRGTNVKIDYTRVIRDIYILRCSYLTRIHGQKPPVSDEALSKTAKIAGLFRRQMTAYESESDVVPCR